MLAIELRQAEIVKLLLSCNPDTTYGSKAVKSLYKTTIHTLNKLKLIILICTCQVGGGTALSHTLHRGLYEMGDLLLQHGVDINQRDKVKFSPTSTYLCSNSSIYHFIPCIDGNHSVDVCSPRWKLRRSQVLAQQRRQYESRLQRKD